MSGSSNFTKAGFLTNLENNHLFQAKNDFDDYTKMFNTRWENSVEIINTNSFNEFEETVVKKLGSSKVRRHTSCTSKCLMSILKKKIMMEF